MLSIEERVDRSEIVLRRGAARRTGGKRLRRCSRLGCRCGCASNARQGSRKRQQRLPILDQARGRLVVFGFLHGNEAVKGLLRIDAPLGHSRQNGC
jgi:Fe2+ transport system protein FeoA